MKWTLLLLFSLSDMAISATSWVAPFTLMSAGDMSGNLTSSTVNILTKDNVGLQFVWTGTPTGTVAVDVSADNTNWTALTFSPAIAPAGGASNAYFEGINMSAPYLRARYTRTSGTGTLVIKVTEKGL